MATPWTNRELATLAALASTFVPGDDGARRASLTADALERAADPSQVAQLRLVLRAMESRIASAALGAGATPFSKMTHEDRERYLLDWGRSRIAQRRTVFASLRKLMTFLAYADPGIDGINPRHAVIGYRPEWPPVTPELTPIVPLALPFDLGDLGDPMTLDADVVVVGSGAGGGVVAAELARAGRSVVILEAGPFVDEQSLPGDELDAFARLYLNHGLLATWDSSVTLLAGSGVGGGTLVNWMTSIEAPPAIREEWRREHGLEGLDDGAEWSDDVAVLEEEMTVTPTAFVPPKDAAILRGAAALAWEAAPTRRNTPGCDDCGSCGFGCRRGAKQSGIRSHLADAYVAGARVVPRVRATRVLIEAGRATGVEGLALVPDALSGDPIPDPSAPGGVRVRRLVVHARQVVMAAGALRTPAVLEGSGLSHTAIGRYLQVHPVSGVLARMPTPVEMWRGPMQGARCLEFGDAEPGRHGYVIESAPGHPGLIALALPWEGAADHARLMADVRYLAPMIAVIRDGGTGRTSVTRSGRIRLDYRLDATGVATLRHGIDRISRLARAAGAVELVVPGAASARYAAAAPASGARSDDATFGRYLASLASFDFGPNRGTVLSAHQMGTARMGAAPRDHACDPHGRIRVSDRGDLTVGGLYVADTSLFPTGIGVNPMLTVMALARRVARTVLAEG